MLILRSNHILLKERSNEKNSVIRTYGDLVKSARAKYLVITKTVSKHKNNLRMIATRATLLRLFYGKDPNDASAIAGIHSCLFLTGLFEVSLINLSLVTIAQ